MATKPYERLRTQVETQNKNERGLPDRKSANVSTNQTLAMNELMAGRMPVVGTSRAYECIHGTRSMETARVLEAYATLMRNGVKEFQPK